MKTSNVLSIFLGIVAIICSGGAKAGYAQNTQQQGKDTMKTVNIVSKDETHIIGLVLHTSFKDGRQAQEIPPFFHDVVEKKTLDIVSNRLNENQVCIFRMKKGSPDFDYIMGVEVSSTENIPEGMESLTLPKSEYAAMPVVKRGNADVLKGFTYLLEEWLPRSDYIQELKKLGFIYYDERFLPIFREQGYAGNPVAELYVPVRQKERKPEIVTKDDMHLIGLVLQTSFKDGRQAREIPPFFHAVVEEKRLDVGNS